MSDLTNLVGMLQNKILPMVLASLVHVPTMYDQIPLASEFDRMGTTNTVRVTRNINGYAVQDLADGGTTVQETKSTDFIDITASRKYVSEQFSHGMSVQALTAWFPTVISNMLESVYRDAVEKGYLAIAATVGIGQVGVDNVAITRDVVQSIKSTLSDADIPALGRVMALGSESENDVASIDDYNRAFSANGVITSESVPNVAGIQVIETPTATLPPGAAGVENIAIWLNAVARVHLDETPTITSERNIVMIPIAYRGLKVMMWLEEVPKSLGGFILSMSSTHGLGVVREEGVVLVLGR